MPSSRRTTGRGGGGGRGAGAGDGGGGDEHVPPFMGNNRDHNPRELRSWARRTGFHPSAFFSGESNSSFASSAPPPPPPASSRRPPPRRDPDPDTEDDPDPAPPLDLERGPGRGRGPGGGGGRPRRRIDLRGELEIPPGFGEAVGSAEPDAAMGAARGDARRRNGVEREAANVGRNANGVHVDADARKKAEEAEAKRKEEEAEARRKEEEERDAELAAYYQEQWANEEEGAADGAAAGETAPLYGASGLRCGVTENPGWAYGSLDQLHFGACRARGDEAFAVQMVEISFVDQVIVNVVGFHSIFLVEIGIQKVAET